MLKWIDLDIKDGRSAHVHGDHWFTGIKMGKKDAKLTLELDGGKSAIVKSVVHTMPKQVSVIAAKGADAKILKVEGGMKLLMNGEDIVALFKEEETAPAATQIKKL